MKAPAKCHGGVALLISLFVFALLGFSSGSRSWSAQTQYDCYSLSKKKTNQKKTTSTTNTSLRATCLHFGCHLNTHTKRESDIAATETDILWECNFEQQGNPSRAVSFTKAWLNVPHPPSLMCGAMKALFIQGAHMFICAHLLSLHLSLALNPSQQQNSLLEIAAFVPTLSVAFSFHLLSSSFSYCLMWSKLTPWHCFKKLPD